MRLDLPPILGPLLACTMMVGKAQRAAAGSGPAPFGATVANSCTLIATETGLMVPNASSRIMSSTYRGGRAATVSARASAPDFRVSAIAPTAFTSGNSTNTSFQSVYRLAGATTAGSTNGFTQTALNAGMHTVPVDLAAIRNFGVFPRGFYSAIVTVGCE